MQRTVTVIGGGIIGLSAAYQLVSEGLRVTVVDPDPNGAKASTGNAGGLAVTEVLPASVPGLIWRVPGWLFDPLGPLSIRLGYAPKLLPWLLRFLRAGQRDRVLPIAHALAALNLRAEQDWNPLFQSLGLSNDLHRTGALALYESVEGYRRDQIAWEFSSKFGIKCGTIDGAEARRMEPALGEKVACAVWLPQWSHVSDPARIHQSLLSYLVGKNVQVLRGSAERVTSDNKRCQIRLDSGATVDSDVCVVAAGAWSGSLCAQLGDPVSLESERGYNVTVKEPRVSVGRELVFAERKFVATPMTCGLRIGGAAEFAGLSAPPNYARAKALAALAKQYLPDLTTEGGVEWMGHRPTTPDSLPVISASRHANVFYAFGHGHLGLTQAATTGILVADLVAGRTPPIDMQPYRIDRFRVFG